MKFVLKILMLSLLVLPACTGVDSVTKKQFRNTENSIALVDVTTRDFDLQDAGSQLYGALEDAMELTGYTLAGKNARYSLKYKVLEFDEGSRLARIATMGMSDSARGKLRVKVALYDRDEMVGAWEIDSWVKGGITGGSDQDLFNVAAQEIADHLKGNN